jgi:transposase-like protein
MSEGSCPRTDKWTRWPRESGKTRRRYGSQFKAMVLAQCDEPGMSVAKVAMSHGINDNVVHRWRQLARQWCCPRITGHGLCAV